VAAPIKKSITIDKVAFALDARKACLAIFLNHQNFDLPINSIRSPRFGQILATVGSNTSPYRYRAFFGVPRNGRILQVTGKFTF
jgi:hypothetical protein